MPHPTVTARALGGAEKHFGSYGIDVVEVGREVDMDESIWGDLDQDLPLRKFVSLLEKLANKSNDPATLWTAGYHYDFRMLGEVGEVLEKSRSLGDALNKFKDFFFLLQNDAHFDLDINERETRIQYRILDTRIWPRRGDAEFTLGLLQGVIEHYAARYDYPTSFQLEDYSGTGIALERQIRKRFTGFGLYNELTIPTCLLYCQRTGHQSKNFDPTAPLINKLRQQHSEKRRNTPLAYQAQCAIFKKIGLAPIDQTNIADALGMSRRTLRRKLSNEDWTFQQLLDNCRKQMAILELTHGRLSFCEIALKTGFSEQSAFTRAFFKWTGQTPSEFRRQLK